MAENINPGNREIVEAFKPLGDACAKHGSAVICYVRGPEGVIRISGGPAEIRLGLAEIAKKEAMDDWQKKVTAEIVSEGGEG